MMIVRQVVDGRDVLVFDLRGMGRASLDDVIAIRRIAIRNARVMDEALNLCHQPSFSPPMAMCDVKARVA
jgi:hypothetical protein